MYLELETLTLFQRDILEPHFQLCTSSLRLDF